MWSDLNRRQRGECRGFHCQLWHSQREYPASQFGGMYRREFKTAVDTFLIESRCTMAQIANLTFSSNGGDLFGPGNVSEVVDKLLDQHQCNKHRKFFLPENNKVMGLMTQPMTE